MYIIFQMQHTRDPVTPTFLFFLVQSLRTRTLRREGGHPGGGRHGLFEELPIDKASRRLAVTSMILGVNRMLPILSRHIMRGSWDRGRGWERGALGVARCTQDRGVVQRMVELNASTVVMIHAAVLVNWLVEKTRRNVVALPVVELSVS